MGVVVVVIYLILLSNYKYFCEKQNVKVSACHSGFGNQSKY